MSSASIFSHGRPEDHARRHHILRELERHALRPVGVMADMQGPKLRVGAFEGGSVRLEPGRRFMLDRSGRLGTAVRASVPHPEIFSAVQPGDDMLLDDGRLRLKVVSGSDAVLETQVVDGGLLSDRKGINLPGVVLPISPLTEKDRADLRFALGLGVEWIALSFVQRPEDVAEARRLIGNRAHLLVKVEKPAALGCIGELVAAADAVMVARGDLGVEMPPEEVPIAQKTIIRTCRDAGKPVIVATQMLESMVQAPAPTRAEVSDVATAVYDGADAVMLSAETAAGAYPMAAVAIMGRVIDRIERDPHAPLCRRDRKAPADGDLCGRHLGRRPPGGRYDRGRRHRDLHHLRLDDAARRPRTPGATDSGRHLGVGDGAAPVADLRRPQRAYGRCARFRRNGAQGGRGRGAGGCRGPPAIRSSSPRGVPFGTPGATNVLRIVRIPAGVMLRAIAIVGSGRPPKCYPAASNRSRTPCPCPKPSMSSAIRTISPT